MAIALTAAYGEKEPARLHFPAIVAYGDDELGQYASLADEQPGVLERIADGRQLHGSRRTHGVAESFTTEPAGASAPWAGSVAPVFPVISSTRKPAACSA